LEVETYVETAKADAAWEWNANPADRHANNRYPDTGLAAVRTKAELMRGEMAVGSVSCATASPHGQHASRRRWRELGLDPERHRRVLDSHARRQLAERPEEDASEPVRCRSPEDRSMKQFPFRVPMIARAFLNDGWSDRMAPAGDKSCTSPDRAAELLAYGFAELDHDATTDDIAAIAEFTAAPRETILKLTMAMGLRPD
jgi:hypothetical protein